MNRFAKLRLMVAAGAGLAMLAAPTLALARHYPWRAVPDINQPGQTLSPPPSMLYPQQRSTASTDRLPRVESQVPLGTAVPGVTPYEMLPNKP